MNIQETEYKKYVKSEVLGFHGGNRGSNPRRDAKF